MNLPEVWRSPHLGVLPSFDAMPEGADKGANRGASDHRRTIMTPTSLDRRIAALVVALLFSIGVAATPAALPSGGEFAQTHARQA